MALFSQSDIDHLISCPKKISECPSKDLKLVGAYWRNGGKLIASDGTKGIFAVFMRKNQDFPENFSVGLSYNANDGRGEITLLRCNGKHGLFHGNGNSEHPHWDFHIHRASEKAIDAGFAAEKYAEKTSEFASYEEAVIFFVEAINLEPLGRIKFYSIAIQADMFEN